METEFPCPVINLGDIALFRGISESTRLSLSRAASDVSLPADASLFREGDPADAWFVVRSGSVRVIRQRPIGGGAVVLRHATAGEVVGEDCALEDGSRRTSVLADTPAALWKLDWAAVQGVPAAAVLQARLRELFDGSIASVSAQGIIPQGEEGIRMVGHRDYVGGAWDALGRLQFDFLIQNGLLPTHCLLDIACGSLRGGVHFIHYLGPGQYLGIEKEEALISLGVAHELQPATYQEKRPEFVVSAAFEFDRFSRVPDFSIAQSLFTHLNAQDVELCLGKLRGFVHPGHVFFATFSEGDSSGNAKGSHSHAGFRYSRREMECFGRSSGWAATYIGDWSHPRGQMMMRYVAAGPRSLWSRLRRLLGTEAR